MSFRVNAWRFRSGTDADLHIEFLEFSGETDPRDDPSIGAALRALEELARGVSEEWVDLP
jgi:hypothetical protein